MAKKPHTILVEVTQQHIAEGHAGDCRACPIALALSTHFPGKLVQVHVDHLNVLEPHPRHPTLIWSYMLPAAAGEFVKAFDALGRTSNTSGDESLLKIKPFSFELAP